MTYLVVVDMEGNVYGVVESEYKFIKATEKLKEKYPEVFFDFIECNLSEIYLGENENGEANTVQL